MLSLFSPNDYSLFAVILGMPLLGALVNGFWGKRLGDAAVKLMTLSSVGTSFVASAVAFFALREVADRDPEGHAKLVWTAWEWMHTTGNAGTNVPILVRFEIDALSGVMMLIVTGVGFLIHVYATSYMAGDRGYARFFSYLNLFIFSMLVLILGSNLPLLFVGWEGVGLCSYLLIGFWYESDANATAGKKAFIANRIGDFGLLSAMFLLVHYTGALDWNGMANGASSLLEPDDRFRVHLWPIGNGQYTGLLSFLEPGYFQAHHTPILQAIAPKAPVTLSAATAVSLCLLLGCTGKSAQIPLYVWLPDAMAGPTPVSALIHAATMVTAGVYLICRMSFVFVLSPFTMVLIAVVGALTALLAATIAVVQNDIKKVLAYSTISQLGFMFLGAGVGAFSAAFFHVFTHAFFKACLFLGAGSVIHSMHARIHDDARAQDIRNMGGLRRWLSLTHWTFAAATAAIIGLPFTSGFFSKDEILYRAFVDRTVNPLASSAMLRHLGLYRPPTWIGPALYAAAVAAAALTAFYMCRLYFLTFWGEFRGWTVGRPSVLASQELQAVAPAAARNASSAPPSRAHSADAHAPGASSHDAHDSSAAEEPDEPQEHAHPPEDLTMPGYAPHESPWQMTVPLIILGAFSLFAGILNPGFHILHEKPLEHWLDPVFKSVTDGAVLVGHVVHGAWTEDRGWAEHMEWPLAVGGFLAFAVGTAISAWIYLVKAGEPARRLAEAMPALYRLVLDKWRVDELYDATILAGVDSLAETSAAVDKWVVDGILARVTALLVAATGSVLRALQTGVVHVYAATMVVGLAAVGWFFAVPHPNASVVDAGNNDYLVIAAPGVGYTYRWDTAAAGQPAKPDFGSEATLKVHLEPGKSTIVHLEVKNVFGLVKSHTIPVTRPPEKQPVMGLQT